MTLDRRQFLAGSAGLLTFLQMVADSSAQAAVDDYKALVCIFLFGANDHNDTLIPYDTTSYNAYYNIRKGATSANGMYDGIAVNRSELAGTALRTLLPDGRQMALHPSMPELKSLFDAGRAACLLNVGPLIVPTTLTQYNNKSVPLPPKLFSHNDQQAYWQSSYQGEGRGTGWGGRAADLMLGSNGGNSNLTCISVNGDALFLSGQSALAYKISSSGVTTVNTNSLYGSAPAGSALKTLLTQTPANLMGQDYTKIMKEGFSTYDLLVSAIGTSASSAITNWFPTSGTNSLSAQLKMVARLIEKHAALGLKRQVFMVGIGGFDLHDFLVTQHPPLLQKVSQAVKEFDDAMVGLGMSDQVTAFTASDFGRTLTSNGDGSDHGWGSHHFILGGAVKGNQFYGIAPQVSTSSSDQVGSGRLLPSTSVDQFGVELARWMGVSATDMATVLPNSRNFDLYKLGFMRG